MYDISNYFEARTLSEALERLENKNAQIIAGGTDVLIKTRERKEDYRGRELVGITRIKELNAISALEDGIEIGACCSFSKIERSPLVLEYLPALAMAAASVGGPQIRNMGTIGGNLVNGAPSADSAPALLCYEATLLIAGKDGITEMPIDEFYLGPGRTNLPKDRILKSIRIKKSNYAGCYIKFAKRNAMDIATLGCCAVVKAMDGRFETLRLAYGVAGPTPLRAFNAESFASGLEINRDNIAAVGRMALSDCSARDSWRASKEFRESLIVELAQRCVKQALEMGE